MIKNNTSNSIVKNKILNIFPIPRGRILKQYAFKHNLLPNNSKKRKVLLDFLEGKDLNRYEFEYN